MPLPGAQRRFPAKLAQLEDGRGEKFTSVDDEGHEGSSSSITLLQPHSVLMWCSDVRN